MILDKVEERDHPDTSDSPLIPLQPYRPSSIFEEIRLQTERSKKRPRVLLFKYGNPAWATARASFAGNFFACAGYEILDQAAFASVEEGILRAGEINPDLLVLCSSDVEYPEMAPLVSEALANHVLIVIAGYPEDSLDILREAGIEHFIHSRSNLLESLKAFNNILL